MRIQRNHRLAPGLKGDIIHLGGNRFGLVASAQWRRGRTALETLDLPLPLVDNRICDELARLYYYPRPDEDTNRLRAVFPAATSLFIAIPDYESRGDTLKPAGNQVVYSFNGGRLIFPIPARLAERSKPGYVFLFEEKTNNGRMNRSFERDGADWVANVPDSFVKPLNVAAGPRPLAHGPFSFDAEGNLALAAESAGKSFSDYFWLHPVNSLGPWVGRVARSLWFPFGHISELGAIGPGGMGTYAVNLTNYLFTGYPAEIKLGVLVQMAPEPAKEKR